ncbi:MAG: NAD(P)/FAD-dependent oxidoreductase [Methanobrevibacter sp.]|uniref:dihydrolipoyl dehydrogenase family protein n=1 Tax=Methanobrevibacter TaxID=2172 RepID=UPI002579C292|nr:NAD(P)/FAD-dependent oxidoreductase [Methanobrevibacter sp.]MBR2664936.1 NAD(P)/FAD-dependent oxidoreductase [Methanobrevibacter sp.]MBR3197312.1 NAD(P)/FAD-dependent oxidoreductase [Methanobrevibacter sp.]MBR7049833.1 NAD(P)/FAD-dependent oxidoreductase [Methanobrevibacter sp.]
MDYDVIYIGSGNASWQGGRFLRKAGLKILIIEQGLYGGACANRGCNSKAIVDSPYEVKALADNFEGVGKAGNLEVDWPSLMKHKHNVIEGMSSFLDRKFDEYDLDVAHGKGMIVDEHTVRVGDDTFTTDKIVIATGLKPVIPDIPGKEYLHDSTDFLDIAELPEHTIIIGAGFVGMEFASILAEAGRSADVVIRGNMALKYFHQPYVQKIIEILKEKNIRFHFNETVTEVLSSVEIENPEERIHNVSKGVNTDEELRDPEAKVNNKAYKDAFTVKCESGLSLKGDYVIAGMGREANVEGIGLENVGLTSTRSGIKVNGYLQTEVPNIYAVGDVADTGIAKLVTVAIHQSKYLAKAILGEADEITYPAVPAVAYTIPRIATVGVPAYVAEKSDEYEVHQIKYGKSYAPVLKNDKTAEAKVIVDKDLQIVGAEIYSAEAENVANMFAFIINKKITLEELDYMIYTFPSSSSVCLYKLHNIHYDL